MIRTRFLRIGTIAFLAGAIPACTATDTDTETAAQGEVDPVLGVAMAGLGARVDDCDALATPGKGADGNFDSAAKTMTVRLSGGGSTVLSVVGNAVTINGWSCFDKDGTALTTSNVRKMNISTDSGNADKLIFDLLPGSFGTIFSASGGVTVNMQNAADTVAVRGNTAANRMKVGQTGTALYLEVSGDNNADIKLSGTGLPDLTDNITFLLGAGNDTFTGVGTSLTANHIDGVTSLSAVAMTQLVVYGGDGDDTLQGGDYNDTLYGGEDNDTFLTAAAADGDDNYFGGAGTDTMSYASRTVAINADINPGAVTATGSVDLWSLSYPVASGVTLEVTVGAGSARTVSIAGAANPAAIASAINLDANFATTDGGSAYLNSMNQLVLKHASSDLTVALTGGAAALLGIGAAVYDGTDADDGDSAATEKDDIMSDVENLTGGTGNDTLVGSAGSNSIKGGDGNDTISGGIKAADCEQDKDVLEGEAGDDTFRMGPSENCGDDVKGSTGTDTVDYQYRSADLVITLNTTANDGETDELDNVRTDNEVLIGGTGDDTITGGSGAETLHGGPGNDVLNGGAGNDTLVGNSGNDTLNGDAGDDVFGCAGDDAVFVGLRSWEDDMGDGDDVMNGGTGVDKVTYAGRTGGLLASMCTDTAIASGAATSTHAQCTDSDGGPGIARLFGTVALTTGMADTTTITIDTNAGTYPVVFAATDDTAPEVAAAINAAVADAKFLAVAEADGTITLSLTQTDLTSDAIIVSGADQATAGFAATTSDTAAADPEDDKIVNAEWLVGGSGADTLTGHTADETIEGGAGIDTISGGDGNDRLYGDADNDILAGGNGDDLLNGGAATDSHSGGAGDGDVCTVLVADTDTEDGTCEVY